MNNAKRIVLHALIVLFAFSACAPAHAMLSWIDSIRDSFSARVNQNITDEQIKALEDHIYGLEKKGAQAAQKEAAFLRAQLKMAKKTSADVYKYFPRTYVDCQINDKVKIPAYNIAAKAAYKTSYAWFGKKISAREALPKLSRAYFKGFGRYVGRDCETPLYKIGIGTAFAVASDWYKGKISLGHMLPVFGESLLWGSLTFMTKNLVAQFLYPGWVKNNSLLNAFACDLCVVATRQVGSLVLDTLCPVERVDMIERY